MKLSSMNQRRWQKFRKHRRGYWSLWIFLCFFTFSLFSELIANDKPLLVSFQGQLYTPFLKSYPETMFGGSLTSTADYRDPYVASLINSKGWMIWAPIRYSYNTINYNLPTPAPSPPSRENLLGTDDQARDVLTRILYGFRISVLFALALTLSSSAIGIFVGAIQGYYGGWVDLIGQRIIEIWSGLPTLYMLIIMASIVQPNFWWLLGIMLFFSWHDLTGLVRAEFLRSRNLEYVRAARALGQTDVRIMFQHILPNAMVSTLTYVPFIFAGSLTTLTSLDFLGFGLPVGSPSLGELVAQGKNNLNAPWLGLTAFFTLSTLLSMLVFIGEAARDAFDPRKQ